MGNRATTCIYKVLFKYWNFSEIILNQTEGKAIKQTTIENRTKLSCIDIAIASQINLDALVL